MGNYKLSLLPIEEQFVEFKKQTAEFFKQTKKIMREASDFFKKANITLIDCKKSMQMHEEVLKEIEKSNSYVEETLCNVLLAIRQNEYLQAWYPAQKGNPEKKVVGKY